MSGLTADFAALDGCRKTMLAQAGQFGGLADGFSGRAIDASMFGTLPAAGALAALAGHVDAGVGTQLSAAEKFLRSVERALDAVRQGVADAEKTNVQAIQAI
ncbi:MAG: hypothetical protein ACM3ML_16380 [Micromonosporaceae bacterium]